MDTLRPTVRQAADGLGGGGIEEVGADGGRRVNAEQQDQQRRHQRAAAHARHANQEADTETGSHIERISHKPYGFPVPSRRRVIATPILPHDTAAGSQNRARRLTSPATKMYTGAGHRQPSSRKKERFMSAPRHRQ